MASELPGAVLFACNHNRVRSPIAEGLMKLMFGDRVYVDSCGLRLDEDDDPDPFAVAVMDELGADLSRHRPKSFADLPGLISLEPVKTETIFAGVNRHRAKSQFRGGAHDSDSDFASIQREKFLLLHSSVVSCGGWRKVEDRNPC